MLILCPLTFLITLSKTYRDRFPRSSSITEKDMGKKSLHRLRAIIEDTEGTEEARDYCFGGWGVDVTEDQERIHRYVLSEQGLGQ